MIPFIVDNDEVYGSGFGSINDFISRCEATISAPLTIDAKNDTYASRPVGNPQYPITCNKHSLISSSFKPLLKPILTCDFSCEMLPLAARILFRQLLCFRDARKETNEITVKLLYFFSKPSLSQILAKHDPIRYSYAGFLNSD
jgi:hypothetical protein